MLLSCPNKQYVQVYNDLWSNMCKDVLLWCILFMKNVRSDVKDAASPIKKVI